MYYLFTRISEFLDALQKACMDKNVNQYYKLLHIAGIKEFWKRFVRMLYF